LNLLPTYKGEKKQIAKDQDTNDIMREVYAAHKYFAKDYDLITNYFVYTDPVQLAKDVFNYCKQNFTYKIESEKLQTTRSPAGILYTKKIDCKHYSGFIAGVLDAMRRKYKLNFELFYRFGSYDIFDTMPGHVFVVMVYNGQEYWIDPVLDSFNKRSPSPISYIDKKIRNMALYRLSGLTPPQNISERVKMRLSGTVDPNANKYNQAAQALSNTLNQATASIPFVGLATGLLSSFFGAGGISDWLTPGGIINELKGAIFGRAFRGGQYWLGEKFRYYILGEDIHTRDADVVTDPAVSTAITTFSVGFGVPIEDYQDILNLEKGADAYINRYVTLGADPALISREAVNRAVDLKRRFFPTEYEGNFSAKGAPPKKWDPNNFNQLMYVVPIPNFTANYPDMWRGTYTGLIPDGEVKNGIVIAGKAALAVPQDLKNSVFPGTGFKLSTGNMLLIGAAVVGGYLLLRKKK
jgi:hypothetical protein